MRFYLADYPNNHVTRPVLYDTGSNSQSIDQMGPLSIIDAQNYNPLDVLPEQYMTKARTRLAGGIEVYKHQVRLMVQLLDADGGALGAPYYEACVTTLLSGRKYRKPVLFRQLTWIRWSFVYHNKPILAVQKMGTSTLLRS